MKVDCLNIFNKDGCSLTYLTTLDLKDENIQIKGSTNILGLNREEKKLVKTVFFNIKRTKFGSFGGQKDYFRL